MTELSREEVTKVEKTDHPDLVGGIVWADCELSWIRAYGIRCYEAGAKSRLVEFEEKYHAEYQAATTARAETTLYRKRVAEIEGMYGRKCDQLAAERAVSDRLLDALKLWKIATDNAEECEFDDMAAFSIPMPLFCDADEATDAAIAEVEALRKEKPE